MCIVSNSLTKLFFFLSVFNLQFYTKANATNSNVVRVAPRPKNPSAAYNYNLANSFPSTTYSANFYPSSVNYPNYAVNSLNYPNYPTANSVQPPLTVTGNATSTSSMFYNPFLAKNHSKTERHRSKPMSSMEKKFNSLKSIGVKKSPQFYSMRVNKCKRHQSFATEPQQLLLINSTNSMPYISPNTKMKNLDQPLYENLTDSIQIHESSLNNECSFASVLDEFNCKPERRSIYRSDSGISNSSYECITPVPAPRTNQRKCQSAPVYMNLPNSSSATMSSYFQQQQQHQQQQHQQQHFRCSTSSGLGGTSNGSGGGSGSGSGGGGGGNSKNSSSGSRNNHHQMKHNSKCKSNLQNGGMASNFEVCIFYISYYF